MNHNSSQDCIKEFPQRTEFKGYMMKQILLPNLQNYPLAPLQFHRPCILYVKAVTLLGLLCYKFSFGSRQAYVSALGASRHKLDKSGLMQLCMQRNISLFLDWVMLKLSSDRRKNVKLLQKMKADWDSDYLVLIKVSFYTY